MTKEISKVHVAVVRATGDMYVVQQIDINHAEPDKSVVRCWGEVTSYKTGVAYTREEARGLSASFTHAVSKAFVRGVVDIVEVAHDGHLGDKLITQGNRNMGGIVRTSFRRAR